MASRAHPGGFRARHPPSGLKRNGAGNLETEYKRKLLGLMNSNARFENVVKAGELEIVDGGTSFECDLVLMSEWKTRLPAII